MLSQAPQRSHLSNLHSSARFCAQRLPYDSKSFISFIEFWTLFSRDVKPPALPLPKASVVEQPQYKDRRCLFCWRPGETLSPDIVRDLPSLKSGTYIILQFSLGFFFFVDASTFSRSARNGSDVHIKFVDWVPGICSALGMLVINSIEKTRLSADSFSYSGSGVAWKARLVLFLGFALMAGGLAGSVVCRMRDL